MENIAIHANLFDVFLTKRNLSPMKDKMRLKDYVRQPHESALLQGCRAGGMEALTHPWPRDVIVVPAVYKEWEREIPDWACPSTQESYAVAPFYQRLDPNGPRFVPNHANEAGIYLRFVVDHYANMPPLTVFIQADAAKHVRNIQHRINSLNTTTLRKAGVGYLPLNDQLVSL